MKNLVQPILGVGIALCWISQPVGAQQAMSQYGSTTGSDYIAPSQPYYGSTNQFNSNTSVGNSGGLSAYEQQEQAIQQSKMLSDRSSSQDFQQMQAPTPTNSPQQFGKVTKGARLRQAVGTLTHVAARTVQVGVPVVQTALIAKSLSTQGALSQGLALRGMYPYGYGNSIYGNGLYGNTIYRNPYTGQYSTLNNNTIITQPMLYNTVPTTTTGGLFNGL
jgi:hypothetical protein